MKNIIKSNTVKRKQLMFLFIPPPAGQAVDCAPALKGKLHMFKVPAPSLLAALLLAACTLPARAAIPAAERQVLIDLYNGTQGDNWKDNSGWQTEGRFSTPGTECRWHGVTCNAAQTRVTEIDLSANNLVGALPTTLNRLRALTVFNVSGAPHPITRGRLDGAIPSLTGLRALRSFHVENNWLTGGIPSLKGLTALREFDVSRNELAIKIPPLRGMKDLKVFNVGGNTAFTGGLPSLKGLRALEVFDASHNRYGGSDLSGPIPALAGLKALRVFNVDGNDLTGNLPALKGLRALEQFDASSNDLTGGIPPLTGLAALKNFNVSRNSRLSGGIPALDGLTALEKFDVNSDVLIGPIPPLAGLPALEVFNAGHNRLTGGIPPLAGLTALKTFSADRNWLGGDIPPLARLQALEVFSVGGNLLTGHIPALAGLTRLVALDVSRNQLTGGIPALDGLTALRNFDVSHNRLTGVPPAAPKQYWWMYLCPNPLSAPSLDDEGWNKATRSERWSQNCSIASTLPDAERQALIDLYRSANGDGWRMKRGWKTAQGDFSAAGTECDWHGVICNSAGTHVEGIVFEHNNLTGALPATLGRLTALKNFQVPGNRLTGGIPPLDGLTALRTFAVADNQLTGGIPPLDGLTALTNFWVMKNHLTGALPAAPAKLLPKGSSLCPNHLSAPSPTDKAWNAATGGEWRAGCTPAPDESKNELLPLVPR